MSTQQTFNPIDFGFRFTADGWYEFNRREASRTARRKRDAVAKELAKAGHAVTKFSLPSQLVSRGGIGSGHPHIEEVVTVYGINVI